MNRFVLQWMKNSVFSGSAVILAIALGAGASAALGSCGPPSSPETIDVTVSHYLKPGISRDVWGAVGRCGIEEWTLVAKMPPGSNQASRILDFDTLHGFEFEWGVEQHVRLRQKELHPEVGDFEYWVEEVYSTSHVPPDEIFTWGPYLTTPYNGLERVGDRWEMDAHPENRDRDGFGPRILVPVDDDVDAKLWDLHENQKLTMRQMTLQYTGDPVEDPLAVLDVELGPELSSDPCTLD